MIKAVTFTLVRILVISLIFSVTYVLPAVICCVIAYNKSLYLEMVTNTPYIIFFGIIALINTFFFMDNHNKKVKNEEAKKLKESDKIIVGFPNSKEYEKAH